MAILTNQMDRFIMLADDRYLVANNGSKVKVGNDILNSSIVLADVFDMRTEFTTKYSESTIKSVIDMMEYTDMMTNSHEEMAFRISYTLSEIDDPNEFLEMAYQIDSDQLVAHTIKILNYEGMLDENVYQEIIINKLNDPVFMHYLSTGPYGVSIGSNLQPVSGLNTEIIPDEYTNIQTLINCGKYHEINELMRNKDMRPKIVITKLLDIDIPQKNNELYDFAKMTRKALIKDDDYWPYLDLVTKRDKLIEFIPQLYLACQGRLFRSTIDLAIAVHIGMRLEEDDSIRIISQLLLE
jgi:hypothetical protein